ncbi:SCAN domain-containing protein 3 [Nosema granulosis]|uniref:SCAN domain-containing protein 3 n=1 Tax=Nosema granulosis TaxID=83296 RepID=A0A9P6KY28_9MICR|nr:SCAN domain-containing protein 3 [Nosema granulosis]
MMVSTVKNKEEYENIVLFLKDRVKEVKMEKPSKKKLKIKAKAFILIDNLLFLKDEKGLHKKVICNDQEEIMVLEATKLHNDNHFGMVRFEAKCNDYFFKIPRDIIRKVVSECKVCIQSQPLKVKEKQIHIVASRPLERLQIDLIDMKQYKEANGQYVWILTVIDVYSKFAWAFPLVTKSAKEVVETLEDLFLMIGPPLILQSDNGKEFVNKEMTKLCETFLI